MTATVIRISRNDALFMGLTARRGDPHPPHSTRYRGGLHHDSPGLKDADQDDACEEAAHVRPPRHTAAGGAQGEEPPDRLRQEPEPEHEPRGELRHLEEEPKRHERDDPRARETDEVTAEHARDRTARADRGDGREG